VSTINCANCGITFDLPDHFEEKRRNDHATFYCPNGHSQYFPGKTKEQKRIEELEQQLARTRERESRTFHELLSEREEWKHLAKTCPICGEEIAGRLRVRENIVQRLADHLRFEHGAVARRRALPRASEAA
jgi:hypothetical protein